MLRPGKLLRCQLLTSCLLGLVVLTASPAKADDFVLSLESAVLFALDNNPEVNIAIEQKKQSEFAVDEARANYFPQVDMSTRVGREYNDPMSLDGGSQSTGTSGSNPSAEMTMSVNQLVFDGFSTQEEVNRRKQLAVSSDFQKQLVHEKIILETVEAYLNILKNQAALQETNDFMSRLEKITGKVSMMLEAGAEDKATSKYAESRMSFAKSELKSTEAALTDSLTDLEFLTGKLPPFKAKLPDIPDMIEMQLNNYYKIAYGKNKDILLNESDKAAIDHELNTAKGKYFPSLNMLLELSQSHDVGGEIGRDRAGSAMLQMNYKIFDGFSRDATKNKVNSKLNEIDYRKERLERDIKQKVRQAYNQMKSLEEEYMIVEDEIVTNTELQDIYTEQFELGEGNVINLIEGEERLYTSKTRLHQLEADLALSGYNLLRNIGLLDKQEFCASC